MEFYAKKNFFLNDFVLFPYKLYLKIILVTFKRKHKHYTAIELYFFGLYINIFNL